MKFKLLRGLDKDQISELQQNFIQAQHFRSRLVEVINEEIESLHSSMRSEALFESPNWSLVQVDRVAQVKALRRIKGLLELKTPEE